MLDKRRRRSGVCVGGVGGLEDVALRQRGASRRVSVRRAVDGQRMMLRQGRRRGAMRVQRIVDREDVMLRQGRRGRRVCMGCVVRFNGRRPAARRGYRRFGGCVCVARGINAQHMVLRERRGGCRVGVCRAVNAQRLVLGERG
jgi:hypothetical protein